MNIYFVSIHRVGDHLLSVNETSLIGVDVARAETIIKGVPRGVVRFVAMVPPKDVTAVGSPPSHHPTSLPSTPPPPPPPPASPLPEVIDEPGIIRVQV